MAEIPAGLVMEVALEHPAYDWWAELGLKWHAVPVISNMMLEIGGIQYTAAPFNGWYMGTEVGSRNLGDTNRYDLLPLVAEKMGLDRENPAILWKDRALIELNTAVLHSYAKAGVSMTNHHDASEQFVHFEATECRKGRAIQAEWAWIVPPMSSSATEVFHREYENKVVCPNFFYR
jgi:nitric-oxide synthase